MVGRHSQSGMTSGAVACEHHLATQIGLETLKRGGSAADALVATIIAVNTLCCYDSDLGGSGFALVREENGDMHGLDFRGTAPAATRMEQYMEPGVKHGGPAVVIPGQMRGLEEIHARYGKLPWGSLLQPSIELAESGIAVTPEMIMSLEFSMDGTPFDLGTSWIQRSPIIYRTFVRDEKLLEVGATYTRPEYASTLRELAKEGAGAFYTGKIAEMIVAAVKAEAGSMVLADLANYQCNIMTPLKASYKDLDIYSLPSPASGAPFLSAMTTLAHLRQRESQSISSLDAPHRRDQAEMQFAYASRTELGDPAFNDNIPAKEERLFRTETAQERAARIQFSTLSREQYLEQNTENATDRGTSHIVTTDSSGLTFSVTTTVGSPFGSRIMVPGLGIVLNDSMNDFSVKGMANWTGYEPAPANYIHAGKRPMSSSCPYIVIDEQARMIAVGGSAGGSTIISTNVQVLQNVIAHCMRSEEALLVPRVHHQLVPNVLHLEKRYEAGRLPVPGHTDQQALKLELREHAIQWDDRIINTPCVIRCTGWEEWDAGADPRRPSSGAGSTRFK